VLRVDGAGQYGRRSFDFKPVARARESEAAGSAGRFACNRA